MIKYTRPLPKKMMADLETVSKHTISMLNKFPAAEVYKRIDDADWGPSDRPNRRRRSPRPCRIERCAVILKTDLHLNGFPVTMTIVGRVRSYEHALHTTCKLYIDPLYESDLEAVQGTRRIMSCATATGATLSIVVSFLWLIIIRHIVPQTDFLCMISDSPGRCPESGPFVRCIDWLSGSEYWIPGVF